ncbi:MAG: hypothetical protein L0323_02825 [Planctomycetes bacterium]|nr:hypothetical protein [Planctomycetota bacterium]
MEPLREGLRKKARENLDLARLLLGRGSVDAAAGRFYYAVLQASIHALRRQGRTPSDFRKGAREWDHGMVERSIHLVRGLRGDEVLFTSLREQRERADYEDDPVDRRKLEFLRHEAVRFVEEVTA